MTWSLLARSTATARDLSTGWIAVKAPVSIDIREGDRVHRHQRQRQGDARGRQGAEFSSSTTLGMQVKHVIQVPPGRILSTAARSTHPAGAHRSRSPRRGRRCGSTDAASARRRLATCRSRSPARSDTARSAAQEGRAVSVTLSTHPPQRRHEVSGPDAARVFFLLFRVRFRPAATTVLWPRGPSKDALGAARRPVCVAAIRRGASRAQRSPPGGGFAGHRAAIDRAVSIALLLLALGRGQEAESAIAQVITADPA